MGADPRDFVFVTERPALIGTFTIGVPTLKPFFVSIVSGMRQRNYQLFVIETRKGSPMVGTSNYLGLDPTAASLARVLAASSARSRA